MTLAGLFIAVSGALGFVGRPLAEKSTTVLWSITLATVDSTGETPEQRRVSVAFRVAGAIMLLAAALRIFPVAIRDTHAVSGGLWAVLVALAGVALVRVARTTELSAWQGL